MVRPLWRVTSIRQIGEPGSTASSHDSFIYSKQPGVQDQQLTKPTWYCPTSLAVPVMSVLALYVGNHTFKPISV